MSTFAVWYMLGVLAFTIGEVWDYYTRANYTLTFWRCVAMILASVFGGLLLVMILFTISIEAYIKLTNNNKEK